MMVPLISRFRNCYVVIPRLLLPPGEMDPGNRVIRYQLLLHGKYQYIFMDCVSGIDK